MSEGSTKPLSYNHRCPSHPVDTLNQSRPCVTRWRYEDLIVAFCSEARGFHWLISGTPSMLEGRAKRVSERWQTFRARSFDSGFKGWLANFFLIESAL